MPSHNRVYMTNGRTLPMRYTSSGGAIVGGAVPLLRKTAVVEGAGIGANKIVGIMSPAPLLTNSQEAKPKPTVFQGGELLNRIAFEPYLSKKKDSRDNIKFLF